MHIGDDGTGFFGNQGTGGDVPRLEVEFEKAVDTAAGYVAQIQRCGTFTTATGGFGEEVFKNGQVGVHHALIYHRKAGGNQALRQFDAVANADAFVVEQCTLAAAGGVEVVVFGREYQRFGQHAFVQQGHGNGVLFVAVQEIGGAV